MAYLYSEEEDMNGVGGVSPEDAADVRQLKPAVSAPASEPTVLRPEDVTAAGDSNLSFYGSKARVVNQKTGAETWYDVDANGGLTERKDAPVSMQIAANDGFAQDDTMRKFEKYNRMKSEEKAKARAGYNKVIADTLGGALDQVYRNKTIREYDGQKYRVGHVNTTALAGANTMLGKLGKNTVKQIFAIQQVAQTDSNQMIGEPQFVIEFNKDGVIKSNGKRIARMLTRSQIENIIRKSYDATGEASRGEDVIKALFRDRAGEIKAEKEKEEAKRLADAKVAEERRKQLESEALARAKVLNDRFGLDTERIKVLGGVSADFAKEHPDKGAWLRDMFSDPKKAEVFSRTNEQAVDADGNPITDDKGMPVYKTLSPEETVKKAGEFYDVASGGGATNPYMSYIDAMLGKGGAGAGETVTEPKAEGTQSVVTDVNAIKEKLKAALARKTAEQQTQGTGQPAPQPQMQQPVAPVEPSASAPAATVQQVEKPQQPVQRPVTTQTQVVSANDGQPTAEDTPSIRQGQFVLPTSRYNKELLDAFGEVSREAPSPAPAVATEQPVQNAEPKRTEYTPAPNPRAKASQSIVTNDGRKRQRGLDMSGTGYADSAMKSVNEAAEREREQKEFEDLADQELEMRKQELAEMARDEYKKWAAGDKSKPFVFSRQAELDALRSDNPLANYGKAVVESNKAVLDAIHSGIHDKFGEAVKNGLERFIAAANEYVQSGKAKKDVATTMRTAYDMIRAELAKGNDEKKRKEVEEIVKPFRNMIPGMNFAPFAK